MKWLKENWFKGAILFVILICALLTYFYAKSQQDLEKQAQIDSLSVTCQKLAMQKKEELLEVGDGFYLGNIYEYKYNPDYNACILAYQGTYIGNSITGAIRGRDLFEIDNLTTGEVIFNMYANPGDTYRTVNDEFKSLRQKYIGSIK